MYDTIADIAVVLCSAHGVLIMLVHRRMHRVCHVLKQFPIDCLITALPSSHIEFMYNTTGHDHGARALYH